LYVGGELIGGSDIALEMYKSGELAELLQGVAANQESQ
jgi:monothiol glutaredoxin